MIIALSGAKGSGKTSVGEILEKHHGFRATSFAEPLKHMAQIAFPQLTDEHLFGPSSQREVPLDIPMRGRDPSNGEPMVRTSSGWRTQGAQEYPEFLTPRTILQSLGTQWGRRLYPDVWADACLGAIEKSDHPHWCITDCRFTNEFVAVKKMGGRVVRLLRGLEQARELARQGDASASHASETELLFLPDGSFDAVIPNETATLEELGLLVEHLL